MGPTGSSRDDEERASNDVVDECYDVAIVGYGPTGQVLASLLAGRGHRVCVLERHEELYGLPRIATIDGETARIVQAAGDIDAALKNSAPRERYVLAAEDGEILVDGDWGGEHVCGFPNRISLHQPDMDEVLDAAVRDRGADVFQGWEVVSLDREAELPRVTARVRDGGHSDGDRLQEEVTVRARFVIGADGAGSTIRSELGIDQSEWPYKNAWLTVDTIRERPLPELANGLSPDGRVTVFVCAPEGRTHGIIPLGAADRNLIRFTFEAGPDPDREAVLQDDTVRSHLARTHDIDDDDVEIIRSAIYAFEGKLSKTWRKGRVLLAGDAAHVMTPFLGQGGCSSVRDAINLAWKLDLVLRDESPVGLLETYEEERKPHVRTFIEESDRLASLVFKRDPEEAKRRNHRLRRHEGLPGSSVFPSIESGVLSGTGQEGAQNPVGEVAPQDEVRIDGRTARLDQFAGWGFQLLGWNHHPRQQLTDTQRDFLERIQSFSVRLVGDEPLGDGDERSDEIAIDRGGRYGEFFSENDICGFLMRPDFIVFGTVTAPGEWPMLVDELRGQLR